MCVYIYYVEVEVAIDSNNSSGFQVKSFHWLNVWLDFVFMKQCSFSLGGIVGMPGLQKPPTRFCHEKITARPVFFENGS